MWHQSAIFQNRWPPFCQIWIIFTHLKLWIASSRHNFSETQLFINVYGQSPPLQDFSTYKKINFSLDLFLQLLFIVVTTNKNTAEVTWFLKSRALPIYCNVCFHKTIYCIVRNKLNKDKEQKDYDFFSYDWYCLQLYLHFQEKHARLI